ncbi:MAG: TlpA disulfide reductase family protein, partial [Acidobacteriota bacterium]
APDYQAEFLNGKPFRLADYRGKVVLLNVWATWCGPCRYELPVLKNLHEGHRSQGLEVVGVSIDDAGMKADVQRFANEEKMNYPIALDPHGTIADLLETTVIPTSVLVDRQGKIVWYHQGLVEADDAELAGALKKAL